MFNIILILLCIKKVILFNIFNKNIIIKNNNIFIKNNNIILFSINNKYINNNNIYMINNKIDFIAEQLDDLKNKIKIYENNNEKLLDNIIKFNYTLKNKRILESYKGNILHNYSEDLNYDQIQKLKSDQQQIQKCEIYFDTIYNQKIQKKFGLINLEKINSQILYNVNKSFILKIMSTIFKNNDDDFLFNFSLKIYNNFIVYIKQKIDDDE
jgi:hypothetical protein